MQERSFIIKPCVIVYLTELAYDVEELLLHGVTLFSIGREGKINP